MATMRDGELLDDNILNSYYHLIEERSNLSGYPSLLRKDIYFYTLLSNQQPLARCSYSTTSSSLSGQRNTGC